MTVLYAVSPGRVARFYEALAGVKRVEPSEGYVLLEIDGHELVIVRTTAEFAAAIELSDPPLPREDAPIKLTFSVESIAATRAAVAGTGGEIYPSDHEWEFRSLVVCDGVDPEGNVIQVRQSVG